MGDGLVIAPSARKHGVSDADIHHAYEHLVRVFDLDDGLTMLIGASSATLPLEIGVVQSATGPVVCPCHACSTDVREEMTMPRTAQHIVDHGDALARRFEDYDPAAGDERDPDVHLALRQAVLGRSDAERTLQDAVARARADGYSWRAIGELVGTTGEAARQRYSTKQHT